MSESSREISVPPSTPQVPPAGVEDVRTKPKDPLNPNNLTEEEKLEEEGRVFTRNSAAVYISLVTQEIFSSKISKLAVKKAMEQIHAQCGNATDPIERMMLEQLTLAHHSIGRLMAKAATSDSFEHAEMYHSTSTKLLGEFGRLALCIKNYRDSSN